MEPTDSNYVTAKPPLLHTLLGTTAISLAMSAAQATPINAQDTNTAVDKQSVTVRVDLDGHQQKGDTDNNGDGTVLESVYRKGDYVVAGHASIITPALSNGKLYDTSAAYLTIGKESLRSSVYAHFGVTNGLASTAMENFSDYTHSLSGMGPSRKSPHSTNGEVMAGLSGRYDAEPLGVKIGDSLKLDLQSSAFLNATTLRDSIGASGFVVLHDNPSSEFRPNLPGMPATDIKSSAFYTGITTEAVAYDVTTHPVGTNPLQVNAVAGLSAKFGNLSVGVEARQPLTSEVQSPDPRFKPINYVGAKIQLDF